MQELEWPLVCECRYDEVHDRMDREDCCLHCDLEEEISEPQERQVTFKKPTAMARRDEENVA
jgi:hypothetical protein